MKKHLLVAAVSAAALLVAAAPASANPGTLNRHNCEGYFLTAGSGPGFGQSVSEEAHEQHMDDRALLLANCGQAHGMNP